MSYPRGVATARGWDTLVKTLARPGLTFLPWWEAFTPGRELLAELDSIRGRVDGALLLFTPDSKAMIHGRSVNIPNLNVLFEFGYFYGHFGPHRVGMVRYGKIYLPSDFGGYIYISGSGTFRQAAASAVSARIVGDFNRWVEGL